MGLISPSLLGLIKCWGGGGVVVQKYVPAFKKNVGGVMPKYFMDVTKCCGGAQPHIF